MVVRCGGSRCCRVDMCLVWCLGWVGWVVVVAACRLEVGGIMAMSGIITATIIPMVTIIIFIIIATLVVTNIITFATTMVINIIIVTIIVAILIVIFITICMVIATIISPTSTSSPSSLGFRV